jgi:hypothetical protein
MIQNLTKLYEGANLSGATEGIIYIPILFDCDLNGVDVLTDAAVSGANAVFSLSKNGVTIGGAGVTINIGSKIGSVTGLNVALVKGDEIVLNLASGAVSSPLTLNLVTDDGIKVPNFRSVWNMATEYSPNDVVMAGGDSYIAITTNTNQPPELNADDWEIFVAKGADGEDGEDGADGSVILNGDTVPSNQLGSNGDYYFVTDEGGDNAGKWYEKIGGAWVLKLDSLASGGGGVTLPDGDLNTTTNKLERINNRVFTVPAAPSSNAVTDTFDTLDALKWLATQTLGGTTITASDGVLRFNIGTTADSLVQILESVPTYNMVDGEAAIRFIDSVNAHNTEQYQGLYIYLDSGNYAFIRQYGFNAYEMQCSVVTDDVADQTSHTIGTYKYFRIKHNALAGTLEFYTKVNSGDGWTLLTSKAVSWSLGAIKVQFRVKDYTFGSTKTITWDDFAGSFLTPDSMTIHTSLGHWNGVAFVTKTLSEQKELILAEQTTEVSDDFNDNSIDAAKWTVTAGFAETSGKMIGTFAHAANSYAKTVYNLIPERHEFIVEVPLANANNGFYTQMIITDGDTFTKTVTVQRLGSNLELNVNAVLKAQISYNSTTHRWWKIRWFESSIGLFTSSDGTEWVKRGMAVYESSITPMYVYLRLVNNAGSTQSSEFDNFSIVRV